MRSTECTSSCPCIAVTMPCGAAMIRLHVAPHVGLSVCVSSGLPRNAAVLLADANQLPLTRL